MTWLTRFRIRSYLGDSIWPSAFAAAVAGMLTIALLRRLDVRFGFAGFGLGADGSRALVAAIAASTFSYVVFTFSMMLLAVQMASQQLTPRIIAGAYRQRAVRIALAIFLYNHMVALSVLARVDASVPQLSVAFAACVSLLSIAAFLYLLDRFGKGLRPASVVARLCDAGRAVIAAVYPRRFGDSAAPGAAPEERPANRSARTISHAGASGVLLAFDRRGLFAAACAAGATIELVPQVGDFVSRGEPLFRVVDGAREVDDRLLRASAAVGVERTHTQDPAFSFRALVDIALKALSPAIHDPTTAVLAIDQLHRLLREVGTRELEHGALRDAGGVLRLCWRTPDWSDYVGLALAEIRQVGHGQMQIARRLLALFDQLLAVLPEPRHAELQRERRLLRAAVARSFPDAEDRTRAGAPDAQGVGGHASA